MTASTTPVRAGVFLQTDPVVGGNADAYIYPADPINHTDISGNAIDWAWLGSATARAFVAWINAINARKAAAAAAAWIAEVARDKAAIARVTRTWTGPEEIGDRSPFGPNGPLGPNGPPPPHHSGGGWFLQYVSGPLTSGLHALVSYSYNIASCAMGDIEGAQLVRGLAVDLCRRLNGRSRDRRCGGCGSGCRSRRGLRCRRRGGKRLSTRQAPS